MFQTLTIAAAIVVVIAIFRKCFKKITVFDYEKGLKYVKGRFVKILEPGQYWILNFISTIVKLDTRPTFVTIPGQEVLSTDSVTLKVSLAACYQVVDLLLAVNKSTNYQEALYLTLQLALREIIGSAKIDELLENRGSFGAKLFELTSPKIEQLGLKLISVDIKDIMFPGELKRVFAQVVAAQKEGLAVLEKTRGETAALRNLTNAAKLVEDNPTLMQLRLLQSSGNTLVVGMPSGNVILTKDHKSIKEQEKIDEDH